MRATRLTATAVAVCLRLVSGGMLGDGQNAVQKQLDRVDWQPTEVIPGARYTGREVCAQCHSGEANAQESTAMAHALTSADDSLVLQLHPRLTFSQGAYRFTIERRGDRTLYIVTDGVHTISLPVAWAFGYGVHQVAQTYLVSHHGSYYEGRVSFFNGTQGLDITLGHSTAAPESLDDALGRVVEPGEIRACFGCHSTAAVSGGRLQTDKLVPGISCEGCHGPGAEHVAAMKAGRFKETHIFNPGSLTPGDLVKFCGACHRTRAHVEAIHVQGIATVRFQPYRLAESLCFNPRDRRISCLACHNAHQNPQREAAFYDSKCLACHSGGKESAPTSQGAAPVCSVAGSRCVTCHMPKYMLAGSHFRFTDHRIRVVRLGDSFD
jgi:hypothetical protein